MGKPQRQCRTTIVAPDKPLTAHQQAMKRLSDAEARQHAADDWGRRNRRKQPLDGLNTGPAAERYATHERCFWTETPDGKALARPLYTQESDGFLLSIEPVKEVRMPVRKHRTVSEVAIMLEVSRTAVEGAIARGELHAFAPFKVKRILLKELIRYLEERGSTPEEIAEVTAKWEASLTPIESEAC